MAPHDPNVTPPVALYTNSPPKRPGLWGPFMAFVAIDVLALLLFLDVWR